MGNRGIRNEGFTLSTYLFIIAIKGLSVLIKKTEEKNKIKGIQVASTMFISPLLFVDDVLIFCEGSFSEWKRLDDIIAIFCGDSIMVINA